MNFLFKLTYFILPGMMIASCGSTKNLQYMQGNFDTSKLSTYTNLSPVIQKGDLLSILVFSDNPTATALYNQSVSSISAGAADGGGGTGMSAGVTAPGYLVDNGGNIQFQGIGQLHIEGLNKAQLIQLLDTKLKDTLLSHPYYNIRFLNYKITLIGDVGRPGVYSIPSERVNLLEALGMAGDLNVTARRDNVRIVREINGKREFGMIDLRKPDIFISPFYQLQQNDIIYVDFNKSKAVANDAVIVRNIGLTTTIISTIAIIVTLLKR